MNIEVKVEAQRGCGYRKPGGKYLIGDAVGMECGKLPILLDYCQCCGAGIKFSRGFQWMSAEFLKGRTCALDKKPGGCHFNCQPFQGCEDGTIKKLGMLWVGAKFYPTPMAFLQEASIAGISKRISMVPKDLVLGETWIMLAHPNAIKIPMTSADQEQKFNPGIFSMFRPKKLEYVVNEDENGVTDTVEELERLEKQGFTIVRVVKDTDAQTSIV